MMEYRLNKKYMEIHKDFRECVSALMKYFFHAKDNEMMMHYLHGKIQHELSSLAQTQASNWENEELYKSIVDAMTEEKK